LFEAMKIASMELKNRIIMAPMGIPTGLGSGGRAFYKERARGGVAAITIGALMVNSLFDDGVWGREGGAATFKGRLRLLVGAIHDEDTKIGIQLHYLNRYPMGSGRTITKGIQERGEPVGPSTGFRKADSYDANTVVRELKIAEIESIIDDYAKGAAIIKELGFDFVEFHSVHHYLASQFLSPRTNRRQDKYGGNARKRMQFGIDCVTMMRSEVGTDYPISVRLGPGRFSKVTMTDAIRYAVELEKAGATLLSVSTSDPVGYGAIPGRSFPEGTFIDAAETIKKYVEVPIVAAGRITTPELAERILAESKADIVAIGRQLIADPFWPAKVAEGKIENIVPCLGCNLCTKTAVLEQIEMQCSVNPTAGRELKYASEPTTNAKRILIIGGGPAGMEAAREAASRGHQVTLAEKDSRLGGQLLFAAIAHQKDEIERFRRYLISQLRTSNVDVRLRQKINNREIMEIGPDVIILATGARSTLPYWARKLLGNLMSCLLVKWPDLEPILRIGRHANNELIKDIGNDIKALYVIGDCSKPRTIFEAITEGRQTACQI